MILSPLRLQDNEETILRKVRVTAAFLDILKADLDERQKLYGQLADYIWSPARLAGAVAASIWPGLSDAV